MKEGWANNCYLLLFEDDEFSVMSDAYGIGDFLPEYRIIGILSWDDFILADNSGGRFRIPTVPLDVKYLENLKDSYDSHQLKRDDRFTGKIKWYTKPLVFGGDPYSEENITWVDLQTHQQLVRWWNIKYRELLQRQQ